ncbi:DUF2157 domain-containing protein [Qipengyuania sp. MTN3-11]|uniref:DUF2157 domain-containing protein n=1 Tax=Qipengyuania sp. MTN3-11 TaxID=3056557 RepID=UPI0036F418D0
MIERKLAAWQRAGLIDARTAAAIEAWEDANARPFALWAVIGIGTLAVGLGVISVVAANWDEIPGAVRLALHFALMGGFAATLWLRGEMLLAKNPWSHEALLVVFAVLGLGFLGHLGQVYQTSSPLWQPMALWLALFGPMIVLRGASWMTALLLAGVLIFACWDFANPTQPLFGFEAEGRSGFVMGLATALPVLLVPLGAWRLGVAAQVAFWRRLEQLGFLYVLTCASAMAIVSGFGGFGGDSGTFFTLTTQATQAGVGLAAAALTLAGRRDPSDAGTAGTLAAAALTLLLAHVVDGSDFGAALLFLALWVAIGAAAFHGGWRDVFQLAVGAVAVRLVILSFELASDLLTSGFGLIAAGLLILGVAWVAVRVSRTLAPPKEAAE